MPTARPFAYNTGGPISGTTQVGDLAIGTPSNPNEETPPFWNGPNEDLGYVIAIPVSGNTQPTPNITNRLFLSPTYKATDIALSNNNQTATQVFSYSQSVLGETLIQPYTTIMFSVQFNSTNPSVGVGGRFIGVGRTDMNYQGPFNGYPGNDLFSYGFNDNGEFYRDGMLQIDSLPTWSSGDIIDIAVNTQSSSPSNYFIWIRVNGGWWNNSETANPQMNSGGGGLNIYNLFGTDFYPVLCPYIYGSMTIQNAPIYGVPNGILFLGDIFASVGFFRTKTFSDNEFINLSQFVSGKFNTPQTFTGATEASTWLTNNGYWNSYSQNGGNGLTPETAGDNALQIKTDYPSSQDGLYWVKNNNISGGTPFQIYADMTTDGGGWTLLLTNQDTAGWTYSNAILLNQFNPVSGGSNYSIVTYADYLKSSGATFQYMIDAYQRNQFGGIWSVPSSYTFLKSDNTQTSITLDIKFGTWNYNNGGIEQHMPWYSNNCGILTTSENPGGEWWGTLVSQCGFGPAPWINGDCGLDGCMPNPGIIWYWVR